jgi:hypothetical protein
MAAAPAEQRGQPDWLLRIGGFLQRVEDGSLTDQREAVITAGAIVTDLLRTGAVESMADIEEHLTAQRAMMHLIAMPMDSGHLPPGSFSVDPCDGSERSHGLFFAIDRKLSSASQVVADPARNLELLRHETGMVMPFGPDHDRRIVRPERTLWQDAVLAVEREAVIQDWLGEPPETIVAQSLSMLSGLIETRQTTWRDIQAFQLSRAAPMFQLAAVPLDRLPPLEGATCLDVVTWEPRQHVVNFAFRPTHLPPDDPTLILLQDQGTNLALLERAGMPFVGPPPE